MNIYFLLEIFQKLKSASFTLFPTENFKKTEKEEICISNYTQDEPYFDQILIEKAEVKGQFRKTVSHRFKHTDTRQLLEKNLKKSITNQIIEARIALCH